MNFTIGQLINELKKKFRYSGRFDDRYFIPDVYGFFVCAECSKTYLDSRIYILADKIAKYQYIESLEPRVLSQHVVLHELVHLITHSLLPKNVRTSYTHAKSDVLFKDLEEAYCEYYATHTLKKVFNQNVKVLKEDEFEVALVSLLLRLIPYMYFKELARLRETKGKKEIGNIMCFFISGITNSRSRFHRQFYSDLAISYVKRPFEKVKTKVNLLNEVESCTVYDLYIVRGEWR